jgi:hypothetical protein
MRTQQSTSTQRLPRAAGWLLLLSALLAGGLLCLAWLHVSLAAAWDGGPLAAALSAPAPLAPEQFATIDRRNTVAPASDFDRLARAAARDGEVRVIAGLRTRFTPEGALGAAQAAAQQAGIVAARRRLLGALAGTDHAVVHEYRTIPAVALRLSPAALGALRRSGQAATLEDDVIARAITLAQTTKIVEATESASSKINRTGAGQTIAVLDTGIDATHPFLQQTSSGPSKVVAEACFASTSSCPDGTTQEIGPGAGAPCTYDSSGCAHGTKVAGIAAGRGTSFSGVARGAKLISVQVFSKYSGDQCSPGFVGDCAKPTLDDELKGLDWVYQQRANFTIAAVNFSIGTSGVLSSDCDASFPATKTAIDNLRSAGIAFVTSSGNAGSKTGVDWPACISTAVAVGATTNSDTVADFSNSSSQVELLAPGVDIDSSVPGGGFATDSGTSFAAPHVSGAWAIMKAITPSASVDTVLADLQNTGKPVTDTANNVTKPRIRVLSAGTQLKDTGFKSFTSFTGAGADLASNGVGLAAFNGGPSSGTITISGVPTDATVTAAYLYWMTIGGPDATAVFAGTSRAGNLVGAARDCWNVNQHGPFRVYRANLPVSAAPGNGSYAISGVGAPPASQGEGASLVLVYTRSGQPTGHVYIREGTMSIVFNGQTITHTFTGLSVPTAPTRANLHVGMADGQSNLNENPLLFAGSAVTPANFYIGSDGIMWDDDGLSINPTLLPAGTTKATNSISIPSTGGDCLTWPYAALAYG